MTTDRNEMMTAQLRRLLAGAGLVALATGCGGSSSEAEEPMANEETQGSEQAEMGESNETTAAEEASVGIAMLQPTDGNEAVGSVRFVASEGGVEVTVDVMGVEPESTHGFHVHEVGDCSAPDGSSAGGHYNPEGTDHALPPTESRHAGDMGNLTSDAEGHIAATEMFQNFVLEGDATIIGRSVILHAGEDQGSQPSGGAGARIACGIIMVAE